MEWKLPPGVEGERTTSIRPADTWCPVMKNETPGVCLNHNMMYLKYLNQKTKIKPNQKEIHEYS